MGVGSYPRSNDPYIRRVVKELRRARKELVREANRVNAIQESIYAGERRLKREREEEIRQAGLDHQYEISQKENSRPLCETPSREVFVEKYGAVDISRIDALDFQEIKEVRCGQTVNFARSPSVYDLLAKVEVNDSSKNLPNYDHFSKIAIYRDMPENERVKAYLEFRENLSRKIESEVRSGSKIEIQEVKNVIQALNLFTNNKTPQIFEEVQKATSFSGNYILIDESPPQKNSMVSLIKKTIIQDGDNNHPTRALFNESDRNIYLNADRISPESAQRGIILHEGFHAAHFQKEGDLLDRLGFNEDIIPESVRRAEIHCEESKVNIQTGRYKKSQGEDPTLLLFDKFGLQPEIIKTSVDRRVFQAMEDKKLRLGLAEEMASFKEFDQKTYDFYLESLDRHKKVFGANKINEIKLISDLFFNSANEKSNYIDFLREVLQIIKRPK